MKIHRLSEIDLARICVLPSEEKKPRLRLIKFGRPPHTYVPMRTNLGDLVNLQPAFFMADGVEPTEWKEVEAAITRASKTKSEAEFNLGVAESLYKFCVENSVRSYQRPAAPWNVGFGQTVRYWWNLYSVLNDRPVFFFPDPRVSNPLTREAARFVVSMMNQRLRVDDPDFADARLLIVKFAKGEGGNRPIRLMEFSDDELFSAAALNAMIQETYKLWIEVLNERADEVKFRPTGTTPMGF